MSFIEQQRRNQEEKLRIDTALVIQGDKELEDFVDENFDILYEKHMSEMPYGTAKARDGDPYVWLHDYYYGKFFGGQGQ